ncbi:MAG: MASE1 domain-containing protein, partial [Polaromonas sp.]|nr:MASE1 domain-containing protein [Polaromonas sp.]
MFLWPQGEKKEFLFPWPEQAGTAVSWSSASFKLLLSLTAVALVYAATAIGGLSYAVVGSTVTLIWAPSGIALAAILLLGYRTAAGVALGAFLANAWTGVPLGVAAGIAVGNTLEAVVGVWLLTRVANFGSAMDRRRDVFAMIALAAVASTTLSALIGVFTLSLGGLVT